MDAAVTEAEDGVEHGHGGPFGAVVVMEDRVVGRGHNEVLHRNDPTAHAEMEAIREACAHLGRPTLEGCVLYSTGEPCPMCLAAIHWARLDRVVFAQTRVDAESLGFNDARFFAAMNAPLMPVEHEPHEGSQKLFDEYEGDTY
jgi:tRNA(Arg) A34 adenosine deaminase TadA